MVLTGIHQPFGAHLRGGRTSCTLWSRWGLSVGLWPGLLFRGTSQGLPMPLTSPCNGGSVLQGQGDSPGGGEGDRSVKRGQCWWDLGHLWFHSVLHRCGAMSHMEGRLGRGPGLEASPGAVPPYLYIYLIIALGRQGSGLSTWAGIGLQEGGGSGGRFG